MRPRLQNRPPVAQGARTLRPGLVAGRTTPGRCGRAPRASRHAAGKLTVNSPKE